MTWAHKWANEIAAQARGEAVQAASLYAEDWNDGEGPWDFMSHGLRYRIKPPPQPHKWQDCIDAKKAGKVVQARDPANPRDKWKDGDWMFHSERLEYRVKPEPPFRYRVALMRWRQGGPPYTATAHNEQDHNKLASHERFVKWISEWKEVEL